MQEQFKRIQEKYPNLSSAMCFVKLIKNKEMASWEIEKWFDKLVDKSDWKGTPKVQIIRWLKTDIAKPIKIKGLK